jgi:hypothetical protein
LHVAFVLRLALVLPTGLDELYSNDLIIKRFVVIFVSFRISYIWFDGLSGCGLEQLETRAGRALHVLTARAKARSGGVAKPPSADT